MSSINTSATANFNLDYFIDYFDENPDMSCPLYGGFRFEIAEGATHFEFNRRNDDQFVGFVGRVEYPNGCAVAFRKGVFVEASLKRETPKLTVWAEYGCWEISFWQKGSDGSWKAGIEGLAKGGWTGAHADMTVYGECANVRDWRPVRKSIKVPVRVKKKV